MGAAGGGAADQQGNLEHAEMFVALHFLGDIRHFFQRRRDQARQANDVRVFHLGAGEDFRTRHHHAHVHHFEVIALQNDGDDILADVMHVAFHGRHDDLAFRLGDDARAFFFQQLFFLDKRNQMGHGLFHHARRFHHLRQEHLALAKQVTDHVHAGHQGALDHVDGAAAIVQQFLARFFRVFHDELRDAVHQRVRQALLYRTFAPGQGLRLGLATRLQGAGKFDHALGRVFAAVQHHVFHALAQFRVQVVVHADHAGVDDAHGHAGLDGVVQEDGMDGFAGWIVAAETEGHVRYAARDLRVRQVFLDPARGVDEVDGVVVVLFDTGGDGKDIWIENDVFRREVQRIDQQVVGARANFDLALEGVGLPFFIEGHDDDGGAVAAAQFRLAQEFLFTFLHGNRIDDGLALHALEARFDDRPFRRVDHDGYARNIGFRGDQVQKARHGGQRVEHRFVHVDVDHLCAVFHLLAGHGQRFVVLLVEDHARERLRARDVGALADVDEQRRVIDDERFQAGKAQVVRWGRHGARRVFRQQFADGGNVLGRGAAAAARHVQKARVGKFTQQGRCVGWQLVKARVAHGVGQARVRVDAHEGVGDLGQLFRVRAHQGGAQCAVQADGQRFRMAYGIPEGGHGLARQDASRGVRDGARNHQRQAHDGRVLLVEQVDGEQGRLAVQGIENGFHQQYVGATFDQALRLLQVGGHQLIEGDVAGGRVVHVGRD